MLIITQDEIDRTPVNEARRRPPPWCNRPESLPASAPCQAHIIDRWHRDFYVCIKCNGDAAEQWAKLQVDPERALQQARTDIERNKARVDKATGREALGVPRLVYVDGAREPVVHQTMRQVFNPAFYEPPRDE